MQLHQSLLRLLPIAAWQTLIRAFAKDLRAPRDLNGIAALLDTTPVLASAAATISLLANDDGHAALLRAAADANIDVADWPRGDSAALAHYLVLSSRTDPRIESLFASARVQLAELPSRETTFEMVASDPVRFRALILSRELREALTIKLRAELAADARATIVDVRVTEAGADLIFDVLRPDHTRRLVAATSDTQSPTAQSIIVYRSDAIRLDRLRARLVISTVGASLPEIYRRVIGEVLFGDAKFFPASPSVDLRPLQDKGPQALVVPSMSAHVTAARVIELEWDSGDDDVVGLSGRDVLRSCERRGLSIAGGNIDRATIRLDFSDGGPKADISIALPHTITVHPEARRELALQFADAAGFTNASPKVDDLHSLDPWVHPRARWEAVLGSTLETFLTAQILVEEQTRMVVAPELPGAGRSLLAFPFPGKPGTFFATSRNRAVAPRTLSAEALAAYRLDLVCYGKYLAKDLGAAGEVTPLGPRGWLDIGLLTLDTRVVRLVLVASAAPVEAKVLSRALRLSSTQSADVALLVPAGRRFEIGHLVVELPSLAGPHRSHVVAALRRELGLAPETPSKKRTSRKWTAPRWHIDRTSESVSLDGVPIPMPSLAYRFLLLLAERPGEVVPGKDLSSVLAPTRLDFQAARQAKMKAIQAVERAFRAANRRPPAGLPRLLPASKKGFRLGGGVRVV